MLVLVRSFSYTPDASFREEFLLHLIIVLLRRFSYTPRTGFSEEFFYTHDAGFSEESPLHS